MTSNLLNMFHDEGVIGDGFEVLIWQMARVFGRDDLIK
jgi:hypothetical protein